MKKSIASVVVAVSLAPMFTGIARTQQKEGRRIEMSPIHDFDFLYGSWIVEHRRLKQRLKHSTDWETFDGTCVVRPLLDGQANIDDNVLDLPAGTYRAASLRAFNSHTHQWSIWWLDSRSPTNIEPAVVGQFRDGVGTFYANDTFEGKQIMIRFTWSNIQSTSAMWQQAFSEDGGQTWETNWIMKFRRA